MYQIPALLEKLVLSGRATYRSKQLGIAEQFVLPVPSDRFIVIFGFRFIPFNADYAEPVASRVNQNDLAVVSFLTSNNFFPFIFKPQYNYVNNGVDVVNLGVSPEFSKSCYIVANTDVGIYISRGIPTGRPNQTLQIAPLPQFYNYAWNNTLGYGGNNAVNWLTGFNGSPGGIDYVFNPLPGFQDNGGFAFLGPNTQVFDQLFTIPLLNGGLDVSGYAMVNEPDAYARQHFIQIDYVEVNSQKPENLEL